LFINQFAKPIFEIMKETKEVRRRKKNDEEEGEEEE
jgi:hypothetical protein